MEKAASERSSGTGAVLVALGIFLSRIAGLLRDKIFAYYFGSSAAGDVFRAALRIPNFLQNLLGEGVLSGSFIPIYGRLLGEKRSEEARELAGAVLGVLAILTTLLVTLGVIATPWLIDLIAPGFEGARRELCIQLVRILFPGIGLLVLSAFCLGVLNSHRKFFLSYVAPVLWNAAIIGTLLIRGPGTPQEELVVITGWGVVIGCVLQLLVQVPTVMKLLRGIPFHVSGAAFRAGSQLRAVVANFIPIVTARGVVQISAYLDTVMASFLPIGALSVLGYAQTLYLLPVSLFGMSISAAELPAMSQETGSEREVAEALRRRVVSACRRISIFIIPTVAGFVFLGPLILKLLYRGGAFDTETSRLVWLVLIGSTLGILATTQARIFSSSFYALRDARTPLRIAILRVALSTGLGALLAFFGPGILGLDASYGTIGLTTGFGLSSWIEWLMLKRRLEKRVGALVVSKGYLARIWAAALLPAGAIFALLVKNPEWADSFIGAIILLGAYGFAYLALAVLLRVDEVSELVRRKVLRRLRLS
jgi:putative peptidoglycan lipid II flippase